MPHAQDASFAEITPTGSAPAGDAHAVSGPLVSVYVPTRNRATLVEAAIRSILRQDHAKLEVLVVDDASEDSTPEVLARVAAADRRVRVFRQPSPRGAAAARNVAIAAARGEFVTGLDDDDLMLPNRIRTLLAGWREDRAFVCSAFLLEGDGWRRPVARGARTIDLDALLHGNCVGNQVLTRTERLRAIGGFDETFVASQDYDVWTRLVQRFGPAVRVAEASMVMRAGRGDRITASPAAEQGARQYLAKHASAMGPDHLRSQRLVVAAAARRPLQIRELLACLSRSNAASVIRYWAIGRIPGARFVRDRVWRLRWPAAVPLPGLTD
jgi:glycosyltransferase involved in cell wall biosynthesis